MGTKGKSVSAPERGGREKNGSACWKSGSKGGRKGEVRGPLLDEGRHQEEKGGEGGIRRVRLAEESRRGPNTRTFYVPKEHRVVKKAESPLKVLQKGSRKVGGPSSEGKRRVSWLGGTREGEPQFEASGRGETKSALQK